ncbi:hypothetical protein [Bacillus mycoides]|uniref:hypothetical protein n=1 Tax=Bacillus mycoides TaxID=1405 RepID=UPI002E1C0B6B|nr:hypothetical protein [Bacillus mycoides]MED1054709.1 hypothetical protein [Bacillus mycoides]MED1088591.1 hypothetical protein [Bacillus mycoides]
MGITVAVLKFVGGVLPFVHELLKGISPHRYQAKILKYTLIELPPLSLRLEEGDS